MSHRANLHWNSSRYQDHLSKVYNLHSKGVVDLTGYIACGDFIAAGGAGQIFKGKWRKPNSSALALLKKHGLPNVVVKLVSIPALMDPKEKAKRFKRMKREIELWRQINHRNILPLVGIACIDRDSNRPALISPWMEDGNVQDFLKQNPTFPAVSFLRDIIEGLLFLHMFKPTIIHGDIKAVNALVNHRKEAYLCDFGLSRFLVDNTLWRTTATQACGTLRWMAPELIEGETCTSTKESDIYAYGMTCYEILSGKVPFHTARTDASVMRKVLSGDRPERIVSCHPDGLWSIVNQCWAQNAEERPSTKEAQRSILCFIEGSDELKEQVINIGKSIKPIDPDPAIEIPKEPPSSLSPSPALHAPSHGIRDGTLLPPTPTSAAPDTGRSNTNLRRQRYAGNAEATLAMLQNAQRQTRRPASTRRDTQVQQPRQQGEEGGERGRGREEKEQPKTERSETERTDETERLLTVTERLQKVTEWLLIQNPAEKVSSNPERNSRYVSVAVAPFRRQEQEKQVIRD